MVQKVTLETYCWFTLSDASDIEAHDFVRLQNTVMCGDIFYWGGGGGGG